MEIIPIHFALRSRQNELVRAMKAGKLFVYPTDTIYGIGCDARNKKSVKQIQRLKERDAKKPISIIAPSKTWIREHVKVTHSSFLNKLPGSYTFIWEKKRMSFLNEVSKGPSIGVRMPDHPFCSLIKKANVPFVTTSVNISGEPPTHAVEDMPSLIARKVDYVVDGGICDRAPSKLYDLTKEKPIRLR